MDHFVFLQIYPINSMASLAKPFFTLSTLHVITQSIQDFCPASKRRHLRLVLAHQDNPPCFTPLAIAARQHTRNRCQLQRKTAPNRRNTNASKKHNRFDLILKCSCVDPWPRTAHNDDSRVFLQLRLPPYIANFLIQRWLLINETSPTTL